MSAFERDGARIFFVDHGGQGPAVVFAHGFLMDHEMFDPQIEALKDEFRCVAWDARGHGETPAPGSFTYWDSARDVLALLDHLGIDHAFLVGMSQGGFANLRAALEAPERVLGLALIDSQAGAEDPNMLPAFNAMRDEFLANGATDDLAASIAAIILGPADHAPWIAKWKQLAPDAIVHPYEALTGREDISDRVGEINCPVLILHGTDDQAIGIEKAEALCGALPRCEGLVRIEGAGHASNLSHPGIVSEALRDFCRRYS